MKGTIAVGPGDGIGPEIIAEGVKVLKAIEKKYGHEFTLNYFDFGGVSIDKFGVPLTEENIQLCRNSDAFLGGSVGGPKWDYPGSKAYTNTAGLRIRKDFDVYANLRPVKVYAGMEGCSPLKPETVKGVDLVVVRENTGGAYFGLPKKQWTENGIRWAVDTMIYSEPQIERILRVGYELAMRRRKKLASIEKQNVTETGKLWRAMAMEMSKDYPEVELEHVLADACTAWLLREPAKFDVLVMGNLYGDIISDEAAAVSGSLGMGGSAQLAGLPTGSDLAWGFYESSHGSAPDIAGKGIANPIATILSVAYMLDYTYQLPKEAKVIDDAIATVIKTARTTDVMESGMRLVGSKEMGDLIVEQIEKS
ncbi:MAG: 3-isopropylmalate dehydrogenase [Dehalococcoidia bacterium]|nr:3-isopropylmalate dehydrogenase [Dehalococcoidia bacterium]